ncbi:hypothetical protein SAMN05421841_4272 [Chryseobacterium wanjuense]|uniref:Uncharacterized protein n=1 Tax=Chryseobacterium wanjuense TaxID=356305 RepID=A0A1I0S4E8_9FLAO|nr:hypothetical protein [Chryseobacterium wanjuense]SEW49664.1 hypothetical protein SAMN05421841_4272 [Chryseobacterium wanjuense]
MKKSNVIMILIAFVGFIILFTYYNSEKTETSDFFKSDEELFMKSFLPIEMNKEKYLGEVADSSNHMNAYMNFGNVCLPMLDQWKDKIRIGDYVSKKKDSLSLFIQGKTKKYYLHFDSKNFDGAPLPCNCSKLSKNF